MDNTVHLGWEKAVLGTGLFEPQAMAEAEDLLPADFTGCHQTIWAEMLALHNRGGMDRRAFVEALRSRNQLSTIGSFDTESTGEEYLAELMSFRGSAMREYADHVIDASIKRQLRQVSALIQADATDERISGDEAADAAERRLLSLRRNRLAGVGLSLGDIMGVFMTRIEGLREGTVVPAWTPPIRALRDLVDYVDEEDYIVIAGRPGKGKSSVLRYCLVRAAENAQPALVFNLENSETEYAKFAVSLVTGIDSTKLKSPRLLTAEELHLVKEAAGYLAHIPLYIVTLGSPSIVEIERIARQYINQKNIKLMGLDYIQLVKNGLNNPVEDISMTSSTYRGMSLKYKVPTLAASQLSREIVHRGENAEPILSDLRGSGSLEQDATMVWFPHEVWASPQPSDLRRFPHNIAPDGTTFLNPKAIPIRMIVAKNRNGGIGKTSPFLWVKSTNDFVPIPGGL